MKLLSKSEYIILKTNSQNILLSVYSTEFYHCLCCWGHLFSVTFVWEKIFPVYFDSLRLSILAVPPVQYWTSATSQELYLLPGTDCWTFTTQHFSEAASPEVKELAKYMKFGMS